MVSEYFICIKLVSFHECSLLQFGSCDVLCGCCVLLPSRRALSSNRSFCLLRVTVDQRFFATVGCNSTTIIRNEIATLFREVNEIFAQTDFDFDSHPDGIQFHIPEVEVLTNAGQPNSGLDQLSLSLEEMLELWADVSVY